MFSISEMGGHFYTGECAEFLVWLGHWKWRFLFWCSTTEWKVLLVLDWLGLAGRWPLLVRFTISSWVLEKLGWPKGAAPWINLQTITLRVEVVQLGHLCCFIVHGQKWENEVGEIENWEERKRGTQFWGAEWPEAESVKNWGWCVICIWGLRCVLSFFYSPGVYLVNSHRRILENGSMPTRQVLRLRNPGPMSVLRFYEKWQCRAALILRYSGECEKRFYRERKSRMTIARFC